MQDITEFLASLNIYRIQVYTPFPIGPVNTYLIKKRPFTLIDPGPDNEKSKQSLAAGLAKAGTKPEQIERIILTHYHTDHSGLAKWLQDISGAKIFIHTLEVQKLQAKYDFISERICFLEEAGLSQEEINEISANALPKSVLPEAGVIPLVGDELLEYDDMKLGIIHLPGHSLGHIGVYDAKNQLFFAGDFVLKHRSPNPFMEPKESGARERLPVIAQFMNSIEIFAGLSIKLILPGHGGLIEGNQGIAGGLLRHHLKTLDTYQSIISGQEISAQQLMRIIHPNVKGFEIFMAISEVVAYLDHLVSAGRVSRCGHGGVFFYSITE